MRRPTCACGCGGTTLRARGLTIRCYLREYHAGTLERFPLKSPRRNRDAALMVRVEDDVEEAVEAMWGHSGSRRDPCRLMGRFCQPIVAEMRAEGLKPKDGATFSGVCRTLIEEALAARRAKKTWAR